MFSVHSQVLEAFVYSFLRLMSFRGFFVSLFLISLSSLTLAQTNPNLDTGLKPYGSYDGGNIDSVDLANGNLHIRAPIFSYPQGGGMPANFVIAYNNKGYKVDQTYHSQTDTYTYK